MCLQETLDGQAQMELRMRSAVSAIISCKLECSLRSQGPYVVQFESADIQRGEILGR